MGDFFRSKNKEVRQDQDGLPIGQYNLTLEKAYVQKANESQAVGAIFEFRVSEDDPNLPNAKHRLSYWYVGKDGTFNDNGGKWLMALMVKLGLPQDTDIASHEAMEAVLAALIRTQIRAKIVENKTAGGQPYFNVQKLIYSSLAESGLPDVPQESTPTEVYEEPIQPEDVPSQTTLDLEPGMTVVIDGQEKATVIAFLEDTQQVLVKNTAGKNIMVSPERLSAIPPTTETVPPPVENITLEKGMMVKAMFDGKPVVGKIYDFDQPKNLVKIAIGGKGYPCDISTVEVIK